MIGRLNRVSELIKREVTLILQTEIDDPEIDGVIVMKVDVTKDLKLARVYFTLEEGFGDIVSVTKALASHVKFVRGELSRRISLKYMPRLSFREDELEKKQRDIDALFEKIGMEHLDDASGVDSEKGEENES